MSEEDHHVDVGALPKFDMPLYASEMTAKDVKSLSLRHGIPLDLHPVALTKEWTMDKLPDDMIGLYEQYFEFSGIRVPFSTLLLAVIKHFRVHISQIVPLGLNRLTMFELYCRSLGIVPSVNLFRVFYKISKQEHWFSFEKRVGKGAGGQIFRETFSGLKGWKKRFFFLDRRAIPDAMAWRHHDSDVNDPVLEDGFNASDVKLLTKQIMDLRPHTTRPLPSDRVVPEKTNHQKRVKVEDPKIVAIRERKARAAAKKREKKREGGDDGEGSRPKTRRKKTVVLKDNLATSEATSSPRPLRTFDPNQTNPSDAAATTAESQEDRSPLVSPRGSAAHSVNYFDSHRVDKETDTLRLRTSRGNVNEAWFRELLVHLAPPVAQEESNALNNATALDQAWFSLARGALSQTDILERFEHLQTDFDRLVEEHAGCEDTIRQLVSTRELSQQNFRLYLDISERFRKYKNDHANCPDRIRLLEDQNNELS
ncbi:hypothetical protein Tco_1082980 [Tanacetum coccineum]|uniref:Transposase (putative) gypsy type domain-containing protein n=1 Tax=Tanacetum coccineum TaxID=301880 RepID=A0ABQ5I231_9ASTR